MVLAFFGFHPVKGLETLLPAFKQVLVTQPQARLLLLGGVESLAAVKTLNAIGISSMLVAKLDLSQRVHLTGYMSAETASHTIDGADIGVLPFNHGLTLKSGSLLALLATLTGGSYAAYCLYLTVTQSSLPPDIDALAAGLLELLNNLLGVPN